MPREWLRKDQTRPYICTSGQSLPQQQPTTKNSNTNSKAWEGRESDFQNYHHIVGFKHPAFNKNYKAFKEIGSMAHSKKKSKSTNPHCAGWVAQLVRALSCTPKGCRFSPRSGHLLEATDPCFSHIDVSLSLLLSPKINKHVIEWGFKTKTVLKKTQWQIYQTETLRQLSSRYSKN